MVLLAAATGLRFGELISLVRSDFALVTSGAQPQWEISITKSTTLVEHSFIQGGPKSAAGNRVMTIQVPLTQPISQHLAANVALSPDALVFSSAHGQHVRNDVFRNNMKRALKKAGIHEPNFTIHSLRHYAATSFVNTTDGNFRDLQRFLGDSTPSAALRYVHAALRQEHLTNQMPIGALLPVGVVASAPLQIQA
jgi:integrase